MSSTDSTELRDFDKADYARLKALELKGIEDYRLMRGAPKLTPDAVVAFINQLSPWNLKTTGLSILEAYTSKLVEEQVLAGQEKILGTVGTALESALDDLTPFQRGILQPGVSTAINTLTKVKELIRKQGEGR